MSDAVFPTLPGLSWGVGKAPRFSTRTQVASTSRQLRASLTPYPIWTFKLDYEVLRADAAFGELQQLMGFFLSRRGAFDSFLFTDPSDYTVTDQVIGTGNGVTTQFQLLRSLGGFTEPVENPNTVTAIKVGGVTQSPGSYVINSTGIVAFGAAPASGAVTWSGTYYFRVHFVEDEADFEQFMYNLYELKSLQLEGAPGNLV